jgi:hypothetical protein
MIVVLVQVGEYASHTLKVEAGSQGMHGHMLYKHLGIYRESEQFHTIASPILDLDMCHLHRQRTIVCGAWLYYPRK